MDTSKTYIEMCDCPEIQEGHHWCRGDVFIDDKNELHLSGDVDFDDGTRQDGSYWMMYSDGGCGCCSSEYEPKTWLPRQDQLQEMVAYHQCPTCHISQVSDYQEGMLNIWEEESMKDASDTPHGWTGPMSMEQLWLAFVMKEKHGKVWTGTEWKEAN